ncbi:MAG TPA: VOC family protein [Alphaproteobacteria bacterium]|nr:VOC family protein [Alphaproteobacteria bacterium]
MAVVESISHSGICVHDLKAAEDFYCNVLGATVHSRVNFKTQDALRGRSVHTSLTLGDYLFAIMLSEDWMNVPPPEQLRGENRVRHAFCVPRERFATLVESLRRHEVPFDGPVTHPERGPFGESVYFRDPTGNFLELVWRRDEAELYNEVQALGHGGGA